MELHLAPWRETETDSILEFMVNKHLSFFIISIKHKICTEHIFTKIRTNGGFLFILCLFLLFPPKPLFLFIIKVVSILEYSVYKYVLVYYLCGYMNTDKYMYCIHFLPNLIFINFLLRSTEF